MGCPWVGKESEINGCSIAVSDGGNDEEAMKSFCTIEKEKRRLNTYDAL
jgi:hypothetical protein